jgi:hypothetical protein
MSFPHTRRTWLLLSLILSVSTATAYVLLVVTPRVRASRVEVGTSRNDKTGLDPAARRLVERAYGLLPLSFEVNQGQADTAVKYLARGGGYNVLLTAREAIIMLKSNGGDSNGNHNTQESPNLPAGKHSRPQATINRSYIPDESVIRMGLVGANGDAVVKGFDELPGKVNYLIGKDSERWHSNIPTYSRVKY